MIESYLRANKMFVDYNEVCYACIYCFGIVIAEMSERT